MSHKTLLLFLLYSGVVWGDLKLPIATRSDAIVMKKPFTSNGKPIWSAGCGKNQLVKSSTVTNGGEHRIQLTCLPVMNHIYHYSKNATGRFDSSNAGLCSLGTVLMCTSHATANSEICASDLKTMDGSSTQTAEKGVIFASQPMCPSSFVKGEQISIRFLNQSPAMKKFQALGGDGGDCRSLGTDFDDVLVKSKAMPRYDDAAAADEDYLPGLLEKKYKTAHKCGGGCKRGEHMVFNTSDNEMFEAVFYPASNCPWVRLCLKAEYTDGASSGEVKCEKKDMVTFLLHNGLVFSGLRKTAYVLKMHQGAEFSRIQVGRQDEKYIHVTTGFRERVVLPAVNTGKMWLQMSRPDCLAQFTEFGYGSILDKEEMNKAAEVPVCVNKKEVKKLEKIVDVTLMPPETPPNEDADKGVTVSETKRPDEMTEAGSRGLRQVEDPEEEEKASQRGWLTWAIFYGFLAGTLTGFLICALIFFLARRSIYQDWYRAMYQRYQTDASGTTGGETGAAFTGGDTTTAGHMTTVGATTACENGMTATSTGATTGTKSAMSSIADTPSQAQTPNESKQTTSMITM